MPNSTMCALPWLNLNTTPQGQVKLCCNITKQQHMITKRVNDTDVLMDWGYDDLDSIWNGEYMRETRDNMLSGRPNSACTVCYKQEALGNTSPRQSANVENAGLLSMDLTNTASLPTSFELRTSTRCNLQCKTCWAGSSNLIAAQQKHSIEWARLPIGDPWHMELPGWMRNNWQAEDQLLERGYASERISLDNFRLITPSLKRLYITGGEPTMDSNLHLYLQELINANNTACNVSFTTNCTLWNHKLMSRLSRFTNTEVQLSIDGHEAVNDFIRQGSAWHDVTNNVARYLRDTNITDIKIYTVISALNALHLEPLLEWVINTVNLHGRKVIWFPIILESPGHQQVTVLPLESRLTAAALLDKKFNTVDWPEYNCIYRNGIEHTLRALRDSSKTIDNDGLFKLRQQLNYQDAVRKRLEDTEVTWPVVLSNLHVAIDKVEDTQFYRETADLSPAARRILHEQWKNKSENKDYGNGS